MFYVIRSIWSGGWGYREKCGHTFHDVPNLYGGRKYSRLCTVYILNFLFDLDSTFSFSQDINNHHKNKDNAPYQIFIIVRYIVKHR